MENNNVTHVLAVKESYYAGTLGADSRWKLDTVPEGLPIAGTYQELRKIVDERENSVYMLSNSEAGRPEYRITSINSQFGKRLINRDAIYLPLFNTAKREV